MRSTRLPSHHFASNLISSSCRDKLAAVRFNGAESGVSIFCDREPALSSSNILYFEIDAESDMHQAWSG